MVWYGMAQYGCTLIQHLKDEIIITSPISACLRLGCSCV